MNSLLYFFPIGSLNEKKINNHANKANRLKAPWKHAESLISSGFIIINNSWTVTDDRIFPEWIIWVLKAIWKFRGAIGGKTGKTEVLPLF